MFKQLLLCAVVALSLANPAGAQWRMPARQVEAFTNEFDYIPTSKTNAQLIFDWLDDNWLTWASSVQLTNAGFQVLSGTNVQMALDSTDDALTNLHAQLAAVSNTASLAPNTIFTNDFRVFPDINTNVFGIWPWLTNVDNAVSAMQSNQSTEAFAGAIVGSTNNGYIAPFQYNLPSNTTVLITHLSSSYEASNTNVLRMSPSTPGRIEFLRAGGYVLSGSLEAICTNGSASAYWYIYDVNGVYQAKYSMAVANLQQDVYTFSTGTLVLPAVTSGSYAEMKFSPDRSTTNPVTGVKVGAVFFSAYKLYNKD